MVFSTVTWLRITLVSLSWWKLCYENLQITQFQFSRDFRLRQICYQSRETSWISTPGSSPPAWTPDSCSPVVVSSPLSGVSAPPPQPSVCPPTPPPAPSSPPPGLLPGWPIVPGSLAPAPRVCRVPVHTRRVSGVM